MPEMTYANEPCEACDPIRSTHGTPSFNEAITDEQITRLHDALVTAIDSIKSMSEEIDKLKVHSHANECIVVPMHLKTKYSGMSRWIYGRLN